MLYITIFGEVVNLLKNNFSLLEFEVTNKSLHFTLTTAFYKTNNQKDLLIFKSPKVQF